MGPPARPARPPGPPAGRLFPLAVLAVLLAALPLAAASRDAPHAARRLSQLPTGGPTVKFAPCNTDGIEIACPWTEEALLTPEQLAAAGSDRSPICCSRLNHRCDVWPLTGGPRCAMCPSICIYTCSPGYACATDPADGCVKCLPAQEETEETETEPECGPDKPCPGQQLCNRGTCKDSPCLAPGACPLDKPLCTVSPAFRARCEAECGAQRPCSGGRLCNSGRCCDDPCQQVKCPTGKQCVRAASSTKSGTLKAQCKELEPLPSQCTPACKAGEVCKEVKAGKFHCTALPPEPPAQPGRPTGGALGTRTRSLAAAGLASSRRELRG